MKLPKNIKIRDIQKKIDLFLPSKDLFISLNKKESEIFRKLFLSKKRLIYINNTPKFKKFMEEFKKIIYS